MASGKLFVYAIACLHLSAVFMLPIVKSPQTVCMENILATTTVFLSSNKCNLYPPFSLQVIVRFGVQRNTSAGITSPRFNWTKGGYTCICLPVTDHQPSLDITVFMDIQTNPGPGSCWQRLCDNDNHIQNFHPTPPSCVNIFSTAKDVQPQMIRYSINQLYKLRGAVKSSRPSEMLLSALKECGILRYRGCRAGSSIRKIRPVPVRISQRLHLRAHAGQQSGNCANIVQVHVSPSCPGSSTRLCYNFPRIMMTNARSIHNKHDELELVLRDQNIDMCAISETWLSHDQPLPPTVDGFVHFMKSREERRGGGVLIFVKNEFNPTPVHCISVPKELEVVWIRLRPNKLPRQVSGIFVAVLYFPPNSDIGDDLSEHLINAVDQLKTAHPDAGFIIMGDFNKFDTKPVSGGCGFKQIVDKFTRENSILDKILTNVHAYYKCVHILPPLGKSDHNLVLWFPNQQLPTTKNITLKRVVRPMRDSDIRCFGRWILNYDWSEVLGAHSTQTKCDKFYSVLTRALEVYFPTRTVRVHQKDKPWITTEIKMLIKQRQLLFTQGDNIAWKKCRNKIIRCIGNAKKHFYHNRVLQLKHDNPASWYSNIKLITSSTAKSDIVINIPGIDQTNLLSIANAINDNFIQVTKDIAPLDMLNLPAYLPCSKPPTVYPWEVFFELSKVQPGKACGPDGIPARLIKTFAYEFSVPLCDILNCSFAGHSVPQQWKKAIIVPIPKSQPASFDKLRPIALTDHFAKIAELFITKLLLSDINHSLDFNQFGSRPGMSTTHCLVDIVNYLAKSANKSSSISTLITTDFSKAFDRVDHSVVISKLFKLSPRDWLTPWIVDFLSGRTQCVRYRGCMSDWTPVTAGVPQGTRLGPVLFLILINDALASASLQCWKYVDDMTIAESVPRGAATEVQTTLDSLDQWCIENKMCLNISKCHAMRVYFGKTALQPFQLTIDNQILQQVQSVKLLGVLIQADLKWGKHIQGIVKKHLQSIETRIVESMAWQSSSPLHDLIQTAGNTLQLTSPVTTSSRTNGLSLPNTTAADMYLSPLRPNPRPLASSEATPPSSALTSSSPFPQNPSHGDSNPSPQPSNIPMSPRRMRSVSLNMFLNKVLQLAYGRLERLCSMLNVSKDLEKYMWTCVEYCVTNKADLLKNRHLDQIIMSCIYSICKVTDSELKFKDIVNAYRTLPHAEATTYRNVDIDGTKENTIIIFYNEVFMPVMKIYILRFQPKNPTPTLSPAPTRSSTLSQSSPSYRAAPNLFISPMKESPFKSPQPVREGTFRSPSQNTPMKRTRYSFGEGPGSSEKLREINERMREASVDSPKNNRSSTSKRLKFEDDDVQTSATSQTDRSVANGNGVSSSNGHLIPKSLSDDPMGTRALPPSMQHRVAMMTSDRNVSLGVVESKK